MSEGGGLKKKKTRSRTAGMPDEGEGGREGGKVVCVSVAAGVSAEETVEWALRTLGDELAPPTGKGQALEELMFVLVGGREGGREGGRGMWDRYFEPTMHLLLAGLKKAPGASCTSSSLDTCPLLHPSSSSSTTEEEDIWASGLKKPRPSKAFPSSLYLSLRGLRHLLRLARQDPQKSPSFTPFLPSLLPSLLACASTPSMELFQHAEKVLNCLLLIHPNPAHLYLSLSSLIAPPSPSSPLPPSLPRPHLLMALRALPKLLPRLQPTPRLVLPSLPFLLPVLVSLINDLDIVVRMSVVATLASLYLVVKDELFPHLHARLRPAQLKLVTIYIDKAVAREGGREGRRPLGEMHVQ